MQGKRFKTLILKMIGDFKDDTNKQLNKRRKILQDMDKKFSKDIWGKNKSWKLKAQSIK
jgi:hypothetical protein